MRIRLLDLLPGECALTSNFEYISLMFEEHLFDKEAVWLIGHFVEKLKKNIVSDT